MAYKPVGADEFGRFPPRVEQRLAADFANAGSGVTLTEDPADPGTFIVSAGTGGGTVTPVPTGGGGGSLSLVEDPTDPGIFLPGDGTGTTVVTDPEVIRDTVNASLVAGPGIAIVPNDAADITTISATTVGGSTDPEVVRDTIAAALVAGPGMSIISNDNANTITLASTATGGGTAGAPGGGVYENPVDPGFFLSDGTALIVSAKDRFNVMGDGVTDDTAALADFVTYMATNGGIGYLPDGPINVTAALNTSGATKAFSIVGGPSTVVRRRGSSGSVWQITGCDNWHILSVDIDGGLTQFPTNANHGFIALDCSNASVRDMTVTNHLNTGIMVYVTTPGTDGDFVIDGCKVLGAGVTTNNGIMLANMGRSFIRNCVTRDILGNPGIGQQLKNSCVNSGIVNGLSINCDDGFSFGTDTVGLGPRRCQVSNLIAVDCNLGYAIGESYNNNYVGLFCDSRSKATYRGAIRIESDARDQTLSGVHILNALSSSSLTPLRLDGVGCSVEVDYLENDGTSASIVFSATSSHNYVAAKRVVQAGTSLTAGAAALTNLGTNNVFVFRGGGDSAAVAAALAEIW